MATRKEIATTKLKERAAARDKAESVAKKKRDALFSGILKAHNAGLTYREIAEIVDLSEIRVAQILRAERNGE